MKISIKDLRAVLKAWTLVDEGVGIHITDDYRNAVDNLYGKTTVCTKTNRLADCDKCILAHARLCHSSHDCRYTIHGLEDAVQNNEEVRAMLELGNGIRSLEGLIEKQEAVFDVQLG